MAAYEKMSKEELIKKLRELEDENTALKNRQNELESLLYEYSEIVKRQFESFDSFIKDIGTKRMIDPLTRVYSREHIYKLINYYHQKAFEENFEYSLITVKALSFGESKELEKEHTLILIGKVLREAVRVPLDSIGRYNENTFIVLLTEITREDAIKVKERIAKLLELKIPELKFEIKLASYPSDSTNLEELIDMVKD
ncbi:diguanylate cyclase [Thermosipho ferrireducens]|uniref:Diguanylate cyclase n=1 Tax=Thermosipho ferrireducens TaxID=2571116 RepID=A0ABX7S690_9BACT|nr:diguanylate cyclase [Thermosipho ferrireducens]QTA37255.1 diguanylate cyclase [Thermosipho ferrireducens]